MRSMPTSSCLLSAALLPRCTLSCKHSGNTWMMQRVSKAQERQSARMSGRQRLASCCQPWPLHDLPTSIAAPTRLVPYERPNDSPGTNSQSLRVQVSFVKRTGRGSHVSASLVPRGQPRPAMHVASSWKVSSLCRRHLQNIATFRRSELCGCVHETTVGK